MKYEVGQEVWVHMPWVDADCWVTGTVIKTTAKRIKVYNDVRGEGYYTPKNVKAKQEVKGGANTPPQNIMKLVVKHKWSKIWELDSEGHYILEWRAYGFVDNKAWHLERDRAPDTLEGKDTAEWHFSTKREALKFYNSIAEKR